MSDELANILTFIILVAGAVFIISPAVLAAEVAGKKSRSKFFWFFVGLFYNFLGVIVICVMPNKFDKL